MKINKIIYIILFAVLFGIVAFSSFWHAIEFFNLANNSWMSIILAFAFEIGQAAVLFALLSSPNDRKKIMPWVLMTMFTLVQVLGNVYSSYKHIILNNVENLRFFKEPVFIWTNLPDDQATVIITYLVGGILPVSALLLTSMLTSFLSNENDTKAETALSEKTEETPQEIETKPEEETIEEPKEDTTIEDESQIITDAASEPVKKVNEDKNGKQTHLVSL